MNFLAWLLEDVEYVTAEVGSPRDKQLKEYEREGFLRFTETYRDTNAYEIKGSKVLQLFDRAALSAD